MRGIISYGGYLPYRRLDRSEIAAVAGTGGGKGTRTVASYDQDTTTLGVEAGRLAMREARPAALWFSTVTPAYVDKANATAIHAALRLDPNAVAADFGGSVRSSVAALRAACNSNDTVLVVSADIRTGLPGSADEAGGGDAGAAVVVGDDSGVAPVIAEFLGAGSATDEFLDRWRTPGDNRSKAWEEKFGETKYVPLGAAAWAAALEEAKLEVDDIDVVVVTGNHARAAAALAKKLKVAEKVVDDLSSTVGNTGAAHPALVLGHALDGIGTAGKVVALVVLADGADVLLFRTTEAIASYAKKPLATQGGKVAYGKFLSWRGMLTVEPPRRPEPARVSASAASRNEDWKYAFVGSKDRTTGAVHLPPARVSFQGGAVDDMEPIPMADATGTIVTFTIDRLAYSPSPPIVFAVVDFDGGGRLPVELTDVDVDEVAIGGRVEMTFRRLNSSDGIHNYFWKARPVRSSD